VDRGNAFTLFFATLVCVISSSVLTFVAKGLQPKQEFNIEIDRKKNILRALGFGESIQSMESRAIDVFYGQHVEGYVVDETGEEIVGRAPEDLDPDADTDLLPLYRALQEGQVTGFAIPISGPGLWSILKGYFALEKDLNTVKGITFYEHKETPGLGGEVEKPWFQNNFKGKKILSSEGLLRSITVLKGKVDDMIEKETEKPYYVDGISGATITSRGVSTFLKSDLQKYQAHFDKLRGRFS